MSVTASPALADGTYTVQAEQSDGAGNTGFSSAVTFSVDTTAPIVSLTNPAGGSSTNDTTPAFQGTGGTLSNVTTLDWTPSTDSAGTTVTITGSSFRRDSEDTVTYTNVPTFNVFGSSGSERVTRRSPPPVPWPA